MPILALTLLFLSWVPLAQADELPSSLAPRVAFETSHGNFTVELDAMRAPLTAENFLRYVRDGAYDGTTFHRVIANFVIQGGGYDLELRERQPRAAIPNESGNGLSNRRGTLGLARDENPHSGSSQFYVNLVDNLALDPLPTRWGYAVFGRVVEGMEVIDRIAHLKTGTVAALGADVPVERPAIRRAWVIDDRPPTPAEPQ
ncbi:MAG TPA: peptidylprolyl isomerase [Steroidobacteraceae bacterium]|nr:peptidylprolyl isomerase [Steroidobacteraceae bacterium]